MRIKMLEPGHRTQGFWSLCLAMQLLCAAWPVVAQQARFTPSPAGGEVADGKTGLIWRRCTEGMQWNGSTCLGTALTFTHEQAMSYAKGQSGWRLPGVKELTTVVDRGRLSPAIDVAAFPATPSLWFWTSTPLVGNSTDAWHVRFDTGAVFNARRNNTFPIRLVRAN